MYDFIGGILQSVSYSEGKHTRAFLFRGVLGRCLDKLFEYGVSDIYQLLGEAVIKYLDLPCEAIKATHEQNQFFITRVPQKIVEVKELIP